MNEKLAKEDLNNISDSISLSSKCSVRLSKIQHDDIVYSVSGRSDKSVFKNMYKDLRQELEIIKRKFAIANNDLNFCIDLIKNRYNKRKIITKRN